MKSAEQVALMLEMTRSSSGKERMEEDDEAIASVADV